MCGKELYGKGFRRTLDVIMEIDGALPLLTITKSAARAGRSEGGGHGHARSAKLCASVSHWEKRRCVI